MQSKMHASMKTHASCLFSFGRFSGRLHLLAIAYGLMWGMGGAAHADTADRDKPMNAEADALRYDDARHTIYLENGWRTRAALFCTAQSYPLARAWVQRMCPI